MKEENPKILYEEESYSLRGACFKLYKHFGGAFKESIIQKALEIELLKHGLNIQSQQKISIYYGGKKIGTYIPDLIVNEKILVELKVKPFLTQEDQKQFWHYLRASRYRLGFLINFGFSQLQIVRRIYDNLRDHQRRSVC